MNMNEDEHLCIMNHDFDNLHCKLSTMNMNEDGQIFVITYENEFSLSLNMYLQNFESLAIYTHTKP